MNYQVEMEKTINSLDYIPRLLLHVCCAPCSSYVLSVLAKYFKIDIVYYNPNINTKEEYDKRLDELKRLIDTVKYDNLVSIIPCNYNNMDFYNAVKGLENESEGGKRCFECYKLRLDYTAKVAKKLGYEYFTTSLSISPYKNVNWLNEIGINLENKYGIKYLVADFKKKNGYKRSIELSAEYDLYRQDYCGCVFSKRDHDIKLKTKEAGSRSENI